MKHESPTLTIFIPAYNAAPYLPATLDSLLSQSFADFEVIVVDDGSIDKTAEIAQRYTERDPRVRLIRSPHRGEVAARNKALSTAHPLSRYFLNHDSDDISLPGKLEKLIRYLDTNREIAIVGTLGEYFKDEGRIVGRPQIEVMPERIRDTFQDVNSMINSATMIRREVFERIGGYREEFRSVDDYDFFMRALLAGMSLTNIPEILHQIRLHSASVGSTRGKLQEELGKQIQSIYRQHRDAGALTILQSPLGLSSSYRMRRATRRLRILHTVQMYYPQVGGSEEVVKQISERLVRKGHDVTVATGLHADRKFTEWNGVKIRQFNISGSEVHGIHGDVESYKKFVRDGDFDVVVNYAAQIWSSDLLFPLHDELRSAKVFIPCGYSGLYSPAYRQYFEKLPAVLETYDRVVHLSSDYRDARFSRQHGLSNSVVIGNAASEEEFLQPSESFRKKFGIETPHFVITVANHYHGKGHNHLLQWFAELKRSDVTLAIIGSRIHGGCWEECLDTAKSLPNVRFFEDLPRKDVVSAFKDADFFWFGSEVECFPLVILEAMAAGTPWLSTDVGNVAELAGGWVSDTTQMALKADTLLDSRTLRSHLGRQGKHQWKEKYTWQRVVDQYERLYLEVSALPRPSAAKQNIQEIGVEMSSDSPSQSGLISVVIPCYKQAHFLPDAVGSVAEQTYRNFEIIIVDDGSPDDTRQTAQSLITKYPDQSIRLVSHSNQGLAFSRNAGIREARGEYILPLDADDKLCARFLQACMDRLKEDPSVSIVAVDLEEFGDSSRRIGCGIPDLEHLAVENQINYCSLFRKSAWEKAGGYRTNMQWGFEDWDFWISCLAGGARVSVVRDYLFQYRRRGESMYSAALEHSAELQAQIVLNHPDLYEKGTEDWAKACHRLSVGAGDAEAHRAIAEHCASRQRWNEALPHLTRLVEAPNVSSEVALLFGLATLKVKEYRRAYKALRRFLDVKPDHAAAQFLAGLAAACVGDLRTARDHAEDATELDLKMASAYELLIAISRAEQDLVTASDLAARCSQQQIEISPWVFAQRPIERHDVEGWASFLYSKYLESSPLPLLVLNRDRLPKPAATPPVRVTVEADLKVSVIMPTCNRPEMLAAAIDSVRKQTMQNFEILVVNDAGSDVETVISHRNRSKKITYVRHGRNLGLAAARNTAIKLARGEYIAYLDDDDLYYPDHLQTLVHCLETHDCSVAYSDANRAHQVRQDGKLVVTHRDLPFSIDFNHDRILVGNFIPVLSVMHGRKCLDDVGLFDESLTSHEDWDLWIRLSQKYRFAHVRRTTCEFSWRTDGSSMTSSKQQDYLRTIEIIYGKTGMLARARPAVLEARSQYLEEKKRLIPRASSPDNSEGRVSVSVV